MPALWLLLQMRLTLPLLLLAKRERFTRLEKVKDSTTTTQNTSLALSAIRPGLYPAG